MTKINNEKIKIQTVLLLVLLVFTLVSLVLFSLPKYTEEMVSSSVPFSYDDSFQTKVLSIHAYEYLKVQQYSPTNVKLEDKKIYTSDNYQCPFGKTNTSSLSNINGSCIQPHYWKIYSYDYQNGTINHGFLIFNDEDTAELFVNETLSTLYIYSDMNELMGYQVESRVSISPTQLSLHIERIEFFIIPNLESEQNMLISLIRTGNVVYIVSENSSGSLNDRQFLYAFTEEYHSNAIELLNVSLFE